MAKDGSIAARRRAPTTPTVPLDNDNLLTEILLRLPPRHSTLPRAVLVCKRWRRLASDPAFLRRFRACRTPPLLGFFTGSFGDPVFTSIQKPPLRIPAARFSLPQLPDERWSLLGCCHGLALLVNRTRCEAVVWDPVTGIQRRAPFPPEFAAAAGDDDDGAHALVCSGAVACAATAGPHGGDCQTSHFKLVLVCVNYDCTQASACLYGSKSGTWGSIASTAVTLSLGIRSAWPSVMVGNAFYWQLYPTILEFDLESQRLAAMQMPGACFTGGTASFALSRTQDGELGIAVLSEQKIKVWARKVDCHGHSIVKWKWVLKKTIDLEMLVSLRPVVERWRPVIYGLDEDNNVIFIMTAIGVFMIHLESNQFTNLFKSSFRTTYFPYTSFYTAAALEVGGDDDRDEVLTNTMARLSF